jgi:hypothetical protein
MLVSLMNVGPMLTLRTFYLFLIPKVMETNWLIAKHVITNLEGVWIEKCRPFEQFCILLNMIILGRALVFVSVYCLKITFATIQIKLLACPISFPFYLLII